jgi:hypothetical protein
MLILALTERNRAGRFCLVSPADFEWASRQCWPYNRRGARGEVGRRGDTLHRAVAARAGLQLGRLSVIPRNGWGLDIRRENLMTCRRGWNKPVKDVHRTKQGWQAILNSRLLGVFETEELAAAAREAAAREAGYLTPALQAELLSPVIEQLEAWVAEGRLIRHIDGAPHIEDRYRISFANPKTHSCCS